jgi:iron complex outermembrane receptor protein
MSNTGFIDKSASFQIGLNRFNYGFEFFLSSVNNEIGILSASHLHTAEDQIRAINSDSILYVDEFTYNINAPKQKVTHNLIKSKVYKRFQGFGKATLQYHFQNNKRLEFDIRRGINKNTASTDLRLKTHTLIIDFDSNFSDKFDFKFGIKGEFQNNFPNPETGVRRIIPDYDKYDFGSYVISNIKLNKNLFILINV